MLQKNKVLHPGDKTVALLLGKQTAPENPAELLRPSQFVFYVFAGDGYALFHTLTKKTVFVAPALIRFFLGGGYKWEELRAQGTEGLFEDGFIVRDGADEYRDYREVRDIYLKKLLNKGQIERYVILPLTACNARCVYCYEQGMLQTSMSPETADQVLRYILATHGPESVRIDWFGGEPLLRPDILDQICEGLRKAGVPYQSSMISNGSLVTPELIGKMTGLWCLDRIQISMDGAEADYVKRKRYVLEQNDYHRVLSAVSQMRRAGIRVTVRVNVDQENLDGLNAFLRDLDSVVTEKQFVSVYFCPLNEVRMGSGDLAVWKRLQDIQANFRAAGFNVSASLLGDGRFRAFHCIADSGNVVICPDGNLYACEHCPMEARIGDIWNGVTDTAARDAFCSTDQVRDNCRVCPYLPLCTPFAACPVKDTHCREIRDLQVAALLQEMRRGQLQDQNTQLC